jgi:aspartate ammonia-lyase
MGELQAALRVKGEQFGHVIKMGRTQLQDAVPMTLGQEFTAYATMVKQARSHIDDAARELLDVSLSATAIGTGITSPPGYAPLVTKRLAECSGVPVRWRPTWSRRPKTPVRSSSSPVRSSALRS